MQRPGCGALVPALCALGIAFGAGPAPAQGTSALERGREALLEGRLDAAEPLLLEAVSEAPESGEAHYFVGQLHLRRDRHAEAIAALERARALAPELDGVDLSLGTAYFEAGRPEDAIVALGRAVERDPDGGAALLLLGLTELRLQRFAAAAGHFERAAEADPDLAQLALYNLGVARTQAGDGRGARDALRRAIDVSPGSPAARHARGLLDRIEQTTAQRRPWRLSAFAGLLYDDNVLTSEVDRVSEEEDAAGVFEVSAGYRLVERDAWHLETGYDFYQSAYLDESDFNLQVHSASLRGSRRTARFDATLDYRYTLSTLGGDRFLDIQEIRPALEFAPSPRWYAVVGPRIQLKAFEDDSDRDADQVSLGAENFFFFRQNRAWLQLGLAVESEDADASRFDWEGFAVGAGLHLPFRLRQADHELDLVYRLRFRDYDDVTPSIGRERDDRIHTARLRVSRRLSRSSELRLEYEYEDADSNLPSADYRQNNVLLSIGFEL